MSRGVRATTRKSTPPRPVRRRLPPEERRAEILDAAMHILRDQGPENCRIEQIAELAGTAKGNFYRYFATWDDLLIAVRDHILDRYRAELLARYADLSSVDWWLALDCEIDRFIDFQLDLGGLHDAVFHGPAALARPSDSYRSATTMIAAFLTAGIDNGAFTPIDVEVTSPLLFDLLHGASDAVSAGLDRRRVVAALRQIVHGTLESAQ
jgi:AcrR family transcriptional regulator